MSAAWDIFSFKIISVSEWINWGVNNWKENLKLVVVKKPNFWYLGHKCSFLSPRIQVSVDKSNCGKGTSDSVF